MAFEAPSTVGNDSLFNIGSASLIWSTADANSAVLKCCLPAGDSTNSPTMLFCLASQASTDFGFWDGNTEPGWAVVDSGGGRFIDFRWRGTFFEFGSNANTTQIAYRSPLNVLSTFVMGANLFFQMYDGSGSFVMNNYSGVTRLYNVSGAIHIGGTGTPSLIPTPTAGDLYVNGRTELNGDCYTNGGFVSSGNFVYTFTDAGSAETNVKTADAELIAVSGASETASNLIPQGAFLLGVSTYVETALGTTNGTTGYQVGDGSDADRFGAITGTAQGTGSDNGDATADFTGAFTSANDVVITAVGGNFDGDGNIRVVAHYIDITPASS